MAIPIDLLDEISKLLEAYTKTHNLAYLAEARIRVDVVGERLARHRGAITAIELEVARVARVAAEEAAR